MLATRRSIPLTQFGKLVARGSFGDKDDPATMLKVRAGHQFYQDAQIWEPTPRERHLEKVDSSVSALQNDLALVTAMDHNADRARLKQRIPSAWWEVLELIILQDHSVEGAADQIFGIGKGKNSKLKSRVTDRLDCVLKYLVESVYHLPSRR